MSQPIVLGTKRAEWIAGIISDFLGVSSSIVEESLFAIDSKNLSMLTQFLAGEGPSKIFVYY